MLVNLNRDDFRQRFWRHASEWGIVVAASLAFHLSQKGQGVGLHTLGTDPITESIMQSIPPRTGKEQLMQILGVLTRVTTTQNQSFESWLTDTILSLNWGATLIVITPEGNESCLATLHQRVRGGFSVVLIVTETYASFDETATKARNLGIFSVNVSNKSDLKYWTRGRFG